MSTVQVTAIPTVKGVRPLYDQMVLEAILNLAKRGGSSKQAIGSYILSNYGKEVSPSSIPVNVRTTVKKLTVDGTLVQNKQSYRVATSRRKTIIGHMVDGNLTKKKLADAKKKRRAAKGTAGRPAPKILADKGTGKAHKTTKITAKTATTSKPRAKSRPVKDAIITLLSENGTTSRDDLVETLTHRFDVDKADRETFRRSVMANITRRRGDLWTEKIDGEEKLITINPRYAVVSTSTSKSKSSSKSDSGSSQEDEEEEDSTPQQRKKPTLKASKPKTKKETAAAKKPSTKKPKFNSIKAAVLAARAAGSDSDSD